MAHGKRYVSAVPCPCPASSAAPPDHFSLGGGNGVLQRGGVWFAACSGRHRTGPAHVPLARARTQADASWSPAPPQRPRAWRAAEAAEEQDVAASLGHRTARSLVAATNPRPELLMGQQLLQQKLQQSLPHWAPPAERELLAEAPANVSHALAELVAVLGAPPLVQAVHCDHPPECSQLDMMQQVGGWVTGRGGAGRTLGWGARGRGPRGEARERLGGRRSPRGVLTVPGGLPCPRPVSVVRKRRWQVYI